MLTKTAGFLFVLLLVAGVPALSYRTAHDSKVRLVPRLALYSSAALSQWILAALGIVIVRATLPNFMVAGFRRVSFAPFVGWVILVALVSLAALGLLLFLAERGWWPKESELVILLIPETRLEKLGAVLLLAPTAALCEEFLYRGYLLFQISQWFHSVPWGWGISSVVFGLAHIYQGVNGVWRATLLGAMLALPVVTLGSLYPSMAAHFLIDALALAWLGPKFLGEKPQG